MKELLLQYARYNIWANKRVIDALLKLEDTLVDKEISSSFPSLRGTVYHTWSAEYIWMQRLQLAERPIWIAGDFKGSFTDACASWQSVSADLVQFVEKQYDDRSFTHELIYYDLKKNARKMPAGQVLHHVFNHSTYHRGQLVTMLRQAGATEIPGTDFIGFVMKK